MTRIASLALSVLLSAASITSAQITGITPRQGVEDVARRQALDRYRAGQELLTAERYEQAAAEFSAAIQLDPLLTLAHYGLGQSYMGLRRYASAIQAFTGCRDAYTKLASMQQTNVLEIERRNSDEIQALREYLNMLRTGQYKGNYQAAEQRVEMRIDDLERTRSTNVGRLQTPAEVSLALGSAYYRNGQAQDAEREWLAAVGVNQRLGEAHNNLAVIYMMTGRKKAAEDAIKAAERARFRVPPQLKEDIRRMK